MFGTIEEIISENTPNGTIHINLKITPKASKSEITGIKENRLCVRIAAPPEDGKANESLCIFLSKMLNCPKRDIVLIKGEKSRLKTVAVPMEYKEKLGAIVVNLLKIIMGT